MLQLIETTALLTRVNRRGSGICSWQAYAEQDTQTLMTGYPADLYAGAPLGPFQPLSLKSKHDLARRVLQAFMSLFSAEQASTLLAPQYRVSWQDVLEEWFASFNQIEQQSIMDVYLDHMTDYRVQRRARVRIESMRWFCLPIYPYMDERLYTTYRSLPLAHLDGERAHRALLCDYKTGLENLPYAGRRFAGLPIYKNITTAMSFTLAVLCNRESCPPCDANGKKRRGAGDSDEIYSIRHMR